MSKVPEARHVRVNTCHDAYTDRRWEITADYHDDLASVTITVHVTNPDGSVHRHDTLSLYWSDLAAIYKHGTRGEAE